MYIPKGKGWRPLGIPAVKDRVVQAALKLVIEPIFEHEFEARSFGFRQGLGFKDLRFALPSESTFSRAFEGFAASELLQRVHARMIKDTLGAQLIGHLSRDSTAREARESIAKQDKGEVVPAKPRGKPARPKKGEVRPTPEPSPLERQLGQTLTKMLFELDTACATGTKKNAQGYKISWKGYKLHLDTACCGVPISAVLTGANVHGSRVALPLILARRCELVLSLVMSKTLLFRLTPATS